MTKILRTNVVMTAALLGVLAGAGVAEFASVLLAQDAGDAGPAAGQSREKIPPTFEDRTEKDQKAPATGERAPPSETDSNSAGEKAGRFGVPLPKA